MSQKEFKFITENSNDSDEIRTSEKLQTKLSQSKKSMNVSTV